MVGTLPHVQWAFGKHPQVQEVLHTNILTTIPSSPFFFSPIKVYIKITIFLFIQILAAKNWNSSSRDIVRVQRKSHMMVKMIYITRSLGALRALISSWRPLGPLDFVLHALRALRPRDPHNGDWIVR